MPIKFHRYVTPTYFNPDTGAMGGLLDDQDLINVVSGGTGAGGSAYADSKKIGGPNNGTYFHAWQDDATTYNFNRGLKALAENADYHDDILRSDLAIPVMAGGASDGSVVSLLLPVQTFLGVGTVYNNAADLSVLFELLDDSDREILDAATGNRIVVDTVTLTPPDTLGGGNFSENQLTLNFSMAIPNGVNYRVYYATRGSLASLPVEVLTYIKIRGAQEVAADVEKLFRSLHKQGSVAWDAAWDSTIWDLTNSGLNERYRKSTGIYGYSPLPAGFFPTDFDEAGAGAWVVRDGPAVSIYNGGASGGDYVDPVGALLRLHMDDSPGGGVSGVAVYSTGRTATAVNEAGTGLGPGLMAFAHLQANNTPNTAPFTSYTRVEAGTAATIATGGGYTTVTLTDDANNWWMDGWNSAVVLGHDLVECTYPDDTVETYVITSRGGTAQQVHVRTLDGVLVTPPAGTCTVRWIGTRFAVGDGLGRFGKAAYGTAENDTVKLDGFYWSQQPRNFTTGGVDNVERTPASFSAWEISASTETMRWGGLDIATGNPTYQGHLFSDGSIEMDYGNLTLDTGDILVSGGAITVTTGDVNLTQGSVVVSTGTVSCKGLTLDGPLTGPITLPDNVDITGPGSLKYITFGGQAGLILGDNTDGSLFYVRKKSSIYLNYDATNPATLEVNGEINVNTGGKLFVLDTGRITCESGGGILIDDTGDLTLNVNTTAHFYGITYLMGDAQVFAGYTLTVNASHAATPGVLILENDATTHKGGKLYAKTGSWIRGDSGADFDWAGSATFGAVTLTDITVDGTGNTVSIPSGNTLSVGGALNRSGGETRSGSGAWTKRRQSVITTGATKSVTGLEADEYLVQADLGLADQTITVDNQPTADGVEIEFIRHTPSYMQCTINADSVDVTIMPTNADGGNHGSTTVCLAHWGGTWRLKWVAAGRSSVVVTNHG